MGPIICICTGNVCRSPMAERLLDKALRAAGLEKPEVHSAGVAAYDGNPATSYSIRAMNEIGVDISSHRSRYLTKKIIDEASLLLVMTQMHKYAIEEEYGPVKTPIHLWREFRENEKQVADPYGADYDSYKHARDAIVEAVPDWVEWVKKNLK